MNIIGRQQMFPGSEICNAPHVSVSLGEINATGSPRR